MRKWRVVGRIYGLKYSWKGHNDRNKHKKKMKRGGQTQLVYVTDININIPNHVKVSSRRTGNRETGVAALESKEKAHKRRRRTVWSRISFKVSSLWRSAICNASIWGWSCLHLLLQWLVNTRRQASKKRISSIPRVAFFWREAMTLGTSCRTRQTPQGGRSSRIL